MSDRKETKLQTSNEEASPLADKNSWVVLVPCCTWNCVCSAILVGVDIFRSLGVIYYQRWVLNEGY